MGKLSLPKDNRSKSADNHSKGKKWNSQNRQPLRKKVKDKTTNSKELIKKISWWK
jgi:hypothetical protein